MRSLFVGIFAASALALGLGSDLSAMSQLSQDLVGAKKQACVKSHHVVEGYAEAA
jgi:hypothetical protein